MLGRFIAALAVVLSSCTIAAVDFAELDANDGVDALDAPPGSLMLVVSATGVDVDELGETTFDVRLSQPPSSPVFVTVEASDELVLSARPALLVFEPSTWNDPQIVTVGGRDDADALDDSGAVALSSTAAGDADVVVTVRDDDKLEVETAPVSGLQVDEGATAPVSVKLSAMPAGDVVVQVTSLDPSVAAVAPGTLTFTSADWNLAQDVLVTGVHDPEADHEDTALAFASPGTLDFAPSTRAVSVIDDEELNIVPSPTTLGTLPEGATTSLTVRMSAAITADLDVAVVSSDPGALAVAPASLRFTPANANTPQTITVTVPQDADTVDETPTINLTTTTPGVVARSVGATIDDDDVQALIAAPAAVTVSEGATATLTVRLAHEPAAVVTVSVTSMSSSVATVTPATLTFMPTDYAMPQTVVVSGAEDQDAATGLTTVRLATVAVPVPTDVAITVTDNDPLAIETDTAAVTLTDMTTATFQVRLRAAPVGTLAVIPTSGDVSAATVSPAMLTFTAANWNAYQTVTVTGVADPDVVNDMVAIALGSAMTPTVTVNATVMDSDRQTIIANPATTTINESMTATVGVRLSHQPSASVVVSASSSAATVASVAPASLTFTPSNYATAQNLTITGVADPDVISETATVTLASSGLDPVPVAVAITDPDVVEIQLSPAALTVTETLNGTIGVSLSHQPSANVTVSVVSSDPGAATVSPAALTFTPANHAAVQAVTVTGVDDADAVGETAVLSFAAAGLTTRMATVTVNDNEVLNVVTSVSSISMTEPGSGAFQVHLSGMPGGNVTVNIASSDPGAATVSPATLTFTSQNYGTDQTVTVQSQNDVDMANESVAINLTGTSLEAATVTAAITDEDPQTIQLSATTLTVGEGGSGAVTVRLAFQPASTVTVTSSSGNAAVATASPAMLTFTPANYATPQTLTISGVEDPDAAAGATTVSLGSPGVPSASVAVTVTDNDPLDIYTTVSSLTVPEAGSATLGVKLTAQPSGNVTVSVVSSDTGAATAAPATLTFSAANYDTLQTVSVAGIGDADTVDETVSLTLTGSGGSVNPKTVAVGVTDDDPLLIVSSASTVSLTEPSTTTFTVRLSAQPQATTSVSVSSADTSAVTVSPTTLSFTTSNYNTNQTVTVTSLDDVDIVSESVAISLAATGLPAVTVTANVSDPDQVAIQPTPTTLTVTEGSTGTVAVRLSHQPNANITVTPSVDTSIATVSPASVTFTPANFATVQNLTITGTQDGDAVNDSTTLSLNGSGAQSSSVALTITDNDDPDVQASVTSLSVNEGATATFQVRLESQPPSSLTVTCSSNDATSATTSPASLTFTTSNYGTYQTVTVTGVQDTDTVNDACLVTCSAPGWNPDTVSITAYDNDTLTTDVTTIAVMEAGSAVMGIRLTAQPSASVVVNIASSDTATATVSPSSRTFTTSNWNTYQMVTITGVDDTDTLNDLATLTLSATGYTSRSVSVTTYDRHTIWASAGVFALGEGEDYLLSVRLLQAPPATVTVTVTANTAGVVSLTPAILTFTTSNWSTDQTVTVTGTPDSDTKDDYTAILISATGFYPFYSNAHVTE